MPDLARQNNDSGNSGGGALRITGSGDDQQAIVICPPDGKDTAVLWTKSLTDRADKFCPRDAAPVN